MLQSSRRLVAAAGSQARGLHLVLLGLEDQLTQGGIRNSTRKLQAGRQGSSSAARRDMGG